MHLVAVFITSNKLYEISQLVIAKNIEHELWSNEQDSTEIRIIITDLEQTISQFNDYLTTADILKLKQEDPDYLIFWK